LSEHVRFGKRILFTAHSIVRSAPETKRARRTL
jgi:hypothetical protein